MTATTTAPALRRHPIRGTLYGLVAGLGVALILIDRAVIALGTLTPIVIVLIGGVLGLVWAWFGPARDAGPPPEVAEEAAEEDTAEQDTAEEDMPDEDTGDDGT